MKNILRRIEKNHSILENNINEIISLGKEVIVNGESKYTETQINKIIEGLFIRGCSYWEHFIADEIPLLILLDPKIFYEELGLRNIKLDFDAIKSIIFFEKIRDLYDIDKASSFCKKYTKKEHDIFSSINKERKILFRLSYAVRNYLAHQSQISKKKAQDVYKQIYGNNNSIKLGKLLITQRGKHYCDLLHNYCLISILMKKTMRSLYNEKDI